MFEFIGRVQRGSRFISSMLTGDFDESPTERQFATWFMERPARSSQRDLFVEVTTGLGGPRGIVAERLIDAITRVWRGEGAQFGDLLAQQLDSLIVFSPPTTAEQKEAQRIALKSMDELKARLRALDEAPAEVGFQADSGPDNGTEDGPESSSDIPDDIDRDSVGLRPRNRQVGRRVVRALVKGAAGWTLWMSLNWLVGSLVGLPSKFYGDPTPTMWAVDISTLVVTVAVLGRLNWPNWPKLRNPR